MKNITYPTALLTIRGLDKMSDEDKKALREWLSATAKSLQKKQDYAKIMRFRLCE